MRLPESHSTSAWCNAFQPAAMKILRAPSQLGEGCEACGLAATACMIMRQPPHCSCLSCFLSLSGLPFPPFFSAVVPHPLRPSRAPHLPPSSFTRQRGEMNSGVCGKPWLCRTTDGFASGASFGTRRAALTGMRTCGKRRWVLENALP